MESDAENHRPFPLFTVGHTCIKNISASDWCDVVPKQSIFLFVYYIEIHISYSYSMHLLYILHIIFYSIYEISYKIINHVKTVDNGC